MTWLFAASAHARLTEQQLSTLYAEVAVQVEQVTGREIEPLPPLKLASEEEFAILLRSESEAWLQGELVQRQGTQASSMIGKYATYQREIYFSPEGLNRVWLALFQHRYFTTPEGLARCVLAHELAHVLQSQTGVYERVFASGDLEQVTALSLVGEGHAVQVHEQVCDEGHQVAMRKILGFGSGTSSYEIGYDFASVQPDIWAVYESPPVDTAMVYLPERYVPAEVPPFEGWQTLERALRAWLPEAEPDRLRVGYHALRMRAPDDKGAERALAELKSAHVAVSSQGKRHAYIALAEFEREEAARAYVSATHLRARASGDRQARMKPRPLQTGGIKGYVAAFVTHPEGQQTERGQIWELSQGPWVLIVHLTGMQLREEQLESSLRDLNGWVWPP